MPAGLTVVILAAQFATLTDATAELAGPLVVVLALAGLVLAPPWRTRLEGWAWAAAGGVFAVFAAPIVLSGRATFGGYIKLDDTATYLAMTDRVMQHGRSLAGLAPSTYEATLATTLAIGYPTGSLMPLGVGHQLLAYDSAWLYQPYLAFLAALLALALYTVLEGAIPSRPARAGAAFLAAQPAILYGYALWGGIKELAGALLLALIAALLPWTLAPRRGPRAVAAARRGVRDARLRPQPAGRRLARGAAGRRRGLPAAPAPAALAAGARRLVRGRARRARDPGLRRGGRLAAEDRRLRQGDEPRQPDRPAERLAAVRDLAGRRLSRRPARPHARLRADRGRDRRRAWAGSGGPGAGAPGSCSST